MHWAWWLQQQMSQEWVAKGVLGAAPFGIERVALCHVLTGGAGGGKTTTLRVIESLLDFFFGSDSLKKSAPTNTAARLLGGDTTHATYKLPRGTMLGRRAKLSPHVLKKFRQRWTSVRAHAVDEVSVLPPHALFHIDLRSRQAKQDEHHTFGNLATCLCGDFLQLPPVEEPSLAMPVDDAGYAQEFDSQAQGGNKEEDEKRKERKEFEHRSGFEIWRECFTVATCLNLNMRTEGVLADILQGMRDGAISDGA